MHLVRVQLPDRPGSLGTVASAMGSCGADISAMEIIEKAADHVVDDFMLTLPPGVLIDELVSSCNMIDGVQVLWVSRYPDSWGLEGDIELLDRMVADPDNGVEILVSSAPVVFHCQWGALVSPDGELLLATELAPDLDAATVALLGDLGSAHRCCLPADFLPLWGEQEVAVCPCGDGRAVVLGRTGGPTFVATTLRRLSHLVALAATH